MGSGCFLRDSDGQELASYEDLDHYSARYANYFVDLGLLPGDRVLVQVEKSAHNLFIYFACLRAGLIYLPLNTAYRQDEVQYFLNDAKPALVICAPENESLTQNLIAQDHENTILMTIDADGRSNQDKLLLSHSKTFTTVSMNADDTAVILYTSGTTGQPKGAMITHGNLADNALTLLEAWDWQKDDIMLHVLPIFHIHGLFVATHLPVLNASPIIFLPKFDVTTIIHNLTRASVYMGVPTHYVRLLADNRLDKEGCEQMRLFTSGSAPLLSQTFSAFHQRTGHTIVERYGMTETGMNTSNPVHGERKPGTVGPALPGVNLRIVNDKGMEVGTGQTGHLQIKGNNVFKGYWRKPEKTREEFAADGYFRTGDLASMDDEGYFSIVGRNKDMIITGGLNVYPKELESFIDDIAGVQESAVIGIPDAEFGEAVVAVIVSEDGSLNAQDIQQQMKLGLANFKVAKQVFFVDSLPRNTMGKVQKNILREKYAASGKPQC